VRTFDADEDESIFFGDLDAIDDDHRRFAVPACVAERAEVVTAGKKRRGLSDAANVERVAHPPDELLPKGGAARRYLVQVTAGHGVVPGMEAPWHALGCKDDDVGRQGVVHLAEERLWPRGGEEIEVGHLGERVNARVRPPRALEFEVVPPGHLADRAGDLSLHGSGVFLDLPAAVTGPGILHGQLESRHRDLPNR